jgi:hypothetical protein
MRKRGLIAHCVCVGEPTTKGEKNDKKMDRHIKKRKKLDQEKEDRDRGSGGGTATRRRDVSIVVGGAATG